MENQFRQENQELMHLYIDAEVSFINFFKMIGNQETYFRSTSPNQTIKR